MNTSNNLVYLTVSALLAFMGISGFFGKTNISGFSIEIEIPEEVYADTMFPVKVTLKNHRKILPVFLIKVKIEGHEVLFPFVDTRSEGTRYVNLSLRERGKYEIDTTFISSVFPFNFFTRFRKVHNKINLVVFPRLKACEMRFFHESQKRLKGELVSDKIGYESEIISIRKYNLGDPVKYINWKATAKTGDLKTKELSSLVFQPVLIDFDKIEIRDLEEKISCIAYILLHFLKKNIPIGLKLKETTFSPGVSQAHKIGMLRALSLYGEHGNEISDIRVNPT
ncbi:MAG: hypothetical protein C0392_01360 [Syntrophus sp. (in: bacteria)]|nr:hypothetical protein [Syntrophus sp. (in: bacteria)]